MIGKINFSEPGYSGVYAASKKDMPEAEIKQKKQTGEIECSTCANRQYVDGSDDPGVSFKTPTKVSPEQAASKVMSHEQEHSSREAAKANREKREVVSSSISIYRSTCPECGRSYVSGGMTRTVTRKKEENDHFAKNFYEKNIAPYFGRSLDTKA